MTVHRISHDEKRANPASAYTEPTTRRLELEFTNVCNATCLACPRSAMPTAGFLEPETLARILSLYDPATIDGVTVAGGGEPMLNRKAVEMLGTIVGRGFATSLITNASAITSARAEELADVGLDNVFVSFWGVRPLEYEEVMGLPFAATLAKVERLRDALSDTGTKLSIIWVRTPEIESTDEEVREFWLSRSIEVDTEDTTAWNRGGLIPDQSTYAQSGDTPDPARRLWCADVYFADSFNWQGKLLLCCCNYFAQQQISLGMAEQGPEALREAKGRIAKMRPIPDMCRTCALPRESRARFLLGDCFDRLAESDRRELTEFPDRDDGPSAEGSSG